MSGLLDKMQATPRSKGWGLLADALTAANDYAQKPDRSMPMGKANPVLSLLANAVSLPSAATTADRVSYGDSLMQGKGQTLQMRPETADVAMMAPFSPKTAMGLLGAADTGVGRAAIVWHGSPHKFDRFDSSKIGTGEGAQAYGHGLYLAESPDVAKTYKDLKPAALAAPIRAFRGAELAPGTPEYHAATLLDGMGLQQARKTVAGWIANADPRMAREAEGWRKTLETLNAAASKADFKQLKNQGNLYQVDLPDEHIAKMLDWDKPLSQQPEVLNAMGYSADAAKRVFGDDATGATLYQWIAGGKANNPANASRQARASKDLMSQGIPGIRYLDGGSRSGGAGTSNFVVFPGNEGLLSILERNGKPLK